MNTIYHRVTQGLTEFNLIECLKGNHLCETLCYSVVN